MRIRKTLNANEMKLQNRARIVNLIRQGGYSRAELSRVTGLTRAAVTLIVEECRALGLITEGDKQESAVGRKSVALTVNGSYGYAVGVNLSRSYFSVGLVSFSGQLLAGGEKPMEAGEGREGVLARICAEIDLLLKRKPAGQFLGIGVTTPGPLDREKGVLLNVPNFQEWTDFPIVDYFSRKYRCPVRLDNNSNAAAVTESVCNPHLFGKSFMELIVDTGVGSGVILYNGHESLNFDCEFGHMCIDAEGERCSCGNVGCAELYASVRSLVAFAKTKDNSLADWKKIADKAAGGDALCKSLVERECRYLSIIITNALNCLQLDAVVFAGDIRYRFELLRPIIQNIVESAVIKNRPVEYYVSLAEDPGILSSANLIIDRWIREEILE